MIWTYVAISPDETYADTIGELWNQWQGWEHMNLLNVVVHVPRQDSVTYWLSCPSMFLCLVFISYSLLEMSWGVFCYSVWFVVFLLECPSWINSLSLSLIMQTYFGLALTHGCRDKEKVKFSQDATTSKI